MEDFNVFDCFAKDVQNRLTKYDQNWLCLIVGETGSGKSVSSLSLANRLSSRGFDCKIHLAFSPEELIQKINADDIKKGDILIFEEASVNMNSKKWYSEENLLLNWLIDTFRDMNIGIIFNLPKTNNLDKSAREMFHYQMETVKIHRKENLCEIKVLKNEFNNHYNKMFRKIPQFITPTGEILYMPKILVPLPPKKILNEYKQLSKEFKQELRQKIEKKLKESRKEVKKKGCIKCGSSDIRYYKTEQVWTCRKCGHNHLSNPF